MAVTRAPVTVLLAYRDAARWVGEAVASLRRQTYRDWAAVLVDDGSTDDSPVVASRAARGDDRFWWLSLPAGGLTPALNAGLAMTRSPLIARLDADDYAMPNRLARQVAFLEAHPEVGVLGSAALEVGPAPGQHRTVSLPLTDEAIRRALPRRNPLIHSTVMLRRSLLDEVGGWDASYPVCQDYALWARLASLTRFANLPEALVVRQRHPGQVSVGRRGEQRLAEARIRWGLIRAGQLRAGWPALRAAVGAAFQPSEPSRLSTRATVSVPSQEAT